MLSYSVLLQKESYLVILFFFIKIELLRFCRLAAEMKNQQLSIPNEQYPQKTEVICNYCNQPGHVIANCNIRLTL